ncbi:MAG: HIT domain-containing protein [Nocardioidaceae bacterium]|nr:HIT domain-containing protein [Nocardioidaceae bacterium]
MIDQSEDWLPFDTKSIAREESIVTEQPCLFCRIVDGEVPSEQVGETDQALAFRDVDPKAPTHILVIPKVHVATLPELAASHPDAAAAMLTLARQAAADDGVGDAYRLVCNNGAQVGQSVFHAHLHVLGGRPMTWPPG